MGAEGNSFCHVISHQLFNDSTHHLNIRVAGVNYFRQNPERFIKRYLDQPWLEYLEIMCKQGTWADNLIIQGVGDALNLAVIIIKSYPNFVDFSFIEATNSEQQLVTVYIGHVDEVCYASTKKLISNCACTANKWRLQQYFNCKLETP